MNNFASYLIFLVASSLPLFLLQPSPTIGRSSTVTEIARTGVILDQASRPGKDAKVAIEIAIQDFNIKPHHLSVLYLQNSRNKPVDTAIAAKELIDKHSVKAILGGHTWEEASAIAEVIGEADHDIPRFLSLADTTPLRATDQWPFPVQAVPTQSTQMNGVAAILQSWGIYQVTLVFETSHLASSSALIITHLSQAFRQTGCELTHILPLTCGSRVLDEELEILKRQQRKVFVMHTSLELGVRLFQATKKMKMTGDGYLWIATNRITDLFHSFNSTMTSSLKGMVGVKSYFPEHTPEFEDFRKSFRQKFRSEYPDEEHDEPGIFGVQGYNAVKLLEKGSPETFDHRRPLPESIVEIVKVMANGYNSVYWTEGLRFSETVDGDINGRFNRQPGTISVAGDVTILSSRHEYAADFTQPYTESGLEMIRSRLSNRPWLFMKPFTAKMWWLMAAMTLCNGFIVWLMERTHCDHLRGSILTSVGKKQKPRPRRTRYQTRFNRWKSTNL